MIGGHLLFALVGVILFTIGVVGVLAIRNLLRRILAVNVMGSGTFLVLVGLAQRDGVADPVPQAMVLTGIVVALASTALALALVRRLHEQGGSLELPGDEDG
ncbi:NADH-quinone oxidoreductase subunit K [Azonexus sp.]|jgi:multicomponent Na+:H+ antiporter subunit C|uniref:NADH-quinone oxidoreductase subunit K n=1 Tax=Azonexus sp. TaxID=1872668 RepID=UPI0035AF15F8